MKSLVCVTLLMMAATGILVVKHSVVYLMMMISQLQIYAALAGIIRSKQD